MEKAANAFEKLFFHFVLASFGELRGSTFESALWLSSIVFGFDMCVECGI